LGKTHEALERAEKEYKEVMAEKPLETQQAMVPKKPELLPARAPLEIYQPVKTKLTTLFQEMSIKTILVTSTAHGDGSSTTAVGLATALARDCQLKVLLIDVNLRSPSLHEVFKIEYDQGLYSLLTRRNSEKSSIFRKQEYGDLYVIPSGGTHTGPLTLFESNRFDNFLKSVREKFSYVILDAPPVNGCAESRILGPKADGVILVMVLNKRKYYIPKWIYKRL